MGTSPGDQQEVLFILGTLMLLSALLAFIFAAANWQRNHPGELQRITRKFIQRLRTSVTNWVRYLGNVSGFLAGRSF